MADKARNCAHKGRNFHASLVKLVICSCNQSDAEFSEYRCLRSIKDINNEKLFKEYLETVVTGQVCQKCHIFLCLG